MKVKVGDYITCVDGDNNYLITGETYKLVKYNQHTQTVNVDTFYQTYSALRFKEFRE